MKTTWTVNNRRQFSETSVIEFSAAKGLRTELLGKYSNGTWFAVYFRYNRNATTFTGSLTACTAFLRAEREAVVL